MIRVQVVVDFLLVFMLLAPAGAAETVPIMEAGATTVRVHFGKLSVEATIITEKRKAALYEHENDSTSPERSVIRAITIKVNGQKISVPASTYCDLVLPHRAELDRGVGLSMLKIEGGDASAAYIVRIEFDSRRVKHATFASALIPDKPLQVTTFYERTLEDRPLRNR